MGSGNGLTPTRRQAIIWTNDYRRIHPSLGLSESQKTTIVPNPHPRVCGTYNQELLTTLFVPDVTQWHCELDVRIEDTFLAHAYNYQQWWWLGSSVALGDHYSDVIMVAMASKFTSLTIVYSTVYSGADEREYQSSASLAYVRGIHRWPVNSPHKWPVTRNFFQLMTSSWSGATVPSSRSTTTAPPISGRRESDPNDEFNPIKLK